MNRFKSEIELAEAVARWAEATGWDVYKEVYTDDGDIDLILSKRRLLWAVETKMTLGNKVMEQAWRRLPYVHQVSVACPRREDDVPMVIEAFAESTGIDILHVVHPDDCRWRVVRFNDNPMAGRMENSPDVNWPVVVREEIAPRIGRPHDVDRKGLSAIAMRAKRIGALRAFLRPEHRDLVAGAPNGNQLTPWAVTRLRVIEFLRLNGPSTVNQIAEAVDHHYFSERSARDGIRRMMEEFGKGAFERVKDGHVVRWAAT